MNFNLFIAVFRRNKLLLLIQILIYQSLRDYWWSLLIGFTSIPIFFYIRCNYCYKNYLLLLVFDNISLLPQNCCQYLYLFSSVISLEFSIIITAANIYNCTVTKSSHNNYTSMYSWRVFYLLLNFRHAN